MRSLLLLTMLTIFFTCCEVGVRTSSAVTVVVDKGKSTEVSEHKLVKDEIEYYIYCQFKGGIHVINHTKEKL